MEITFGNRKIIRTFSKFPARKKLAQALEAKGIDSTKILRTYKKPAQKEALIELVGQIGNRVRENKPSSEIFKVLKQFKASQEATIKSKKGLREVLGAIKDSFKAKEAMDNGVAHPKIDWMFFNP